MHFPRSAGPRPSLASGNAKPLPRQAQERHWALGDRGKSQRPGKVFPGESGINGFTEVPHWLWHGSFGVTPYPYPRSPGYGKWATMCTTPAAVTRHNEDKPPTPSGLLWRENPQSNGLLPTPRLGEVSKLCPFEAQASMIIHCIS